MKVSRLYELRIQDPQRSRGITGWSGSFAASPECTRERFGCSSQVPAARPVVPAVPLCVMRGNLALGQVQPAHRISSDEDDPSRGNRFKISTHKLACRAPPINFRLLKSGHLPLSGSAMNQSRREYLFLGKSCVFRTCFALGSFVLLRILL
jgi:hypothetical protein